MMVKRTSISEKRHDDKHRVEEHSEVGTGSGIDGRHPAQSRTLVCVVACMKNGGSVFDPGISLRVVMVTECRFWSNFPILHAVIVRKT